MNDKSKFISCYLDEYVIMAYRKLIKHVDNNEERKLINYLYYLLDRFADGELFEYVYNNEIV